VPEFTQKSSGLSCQRLDIIRIEFIICMKEAASLLVDKPA